MTTDWEAIGHTLGESLSAFHSLVVCGMDADATARVAIALARVQSAHRRVAVGDLIGHVPALSGLVTDDDVHGLVDSFLYGISLTRIARPIPGAGELYLLPTGSEPPDHEALLGQPRWGRLASGFHELGALLVLVVPADAPRIADLVSQTDGAVIVGDEVPADLPVSRVVTILRPTAPEPSPVPTSVAPPVVQAPAFAIPPRRSLPPSGVPAPVQPTPRHAGLTVSLYAAAGIGMTAAIVLFVIWLLRPPAVRGGSNTRAPQGVAALDSGGPGADSSAPGSPAIAAGNASESALVPANPGDSATAARYAVRITTANTEAGAILKVQHDGHDLPAATFAPRIFQGTRWFAVLSGAFAGRAGADSLLNDLRVRKLVDASSGVVERVPYAFLIDSIDAGTAAVAVPALLADHLQRGLPVYALRQDNGTVWILVGAFETPEQAALYEGSLRAAATFVVPTLVYRKGRMF